MQRSWTPAICRLILSKLLIITATTLAQALVTSHLDYCNSLLTGFLQSSPVLHLCLLSIPASFIFLVKPFAAPFYHPLLESSLTSPLCWHQPHSIFFLFIERPLLQSLSCLHNCTVSSESIALPSWLMTIFVCQKTVTSHAKLLFIRISFIKIVFFF